MSAKPEEPCAKLSKKCGLCAGDAGGDDGQGYPFPEPILYRARGSVCCEACYEDNEDLLETARVPAEPKTCCWCEVDVGELGKSPYPVALRPKVCCNACYDKLVVPALESEGPNKPCCLCDHEAGFGCCCVNSTVSRLDSVVELTARRPDCARRADCSAA